MTDSPSNLDPTLDSALQAHAHGWTPTPLYPAKKRPVWSEWPTLHFDSAEEVREEFWRSSEKFGSDPLNIGLALGPAHGGLVDIDLDHHRALAIARDLLPDTAMRSGRPGNPGSHFWYVVDGYDPGISAFKLPDGTMIVEYRGGGGQTAIPPSLHPDGDTYEWSGEEWGGDLGPTRLSADEGKRLHSTVMSIALLVTLADNWPKKGGRHAAYLPLVGGLLRDADADGNPRVHPLWDHNIEPIIRALVSITNDSDGARTRITEAVNTTRRKIVKGDKVQGWPTLAKIIGEDHVGKAREIIERIEELAEMPRAKVRKGTEADWYDESPALRVVTDDERVPSETAEERDVRVAKLDDALRDPLEERVNQWESVDLGPYLRGGAKPVEPALLVRDDGAGLIYPGRVNLLFGEGGSGKTLIALDIAARLIESDQRAMFIDMEDEPVNTISRLHALGLDDQQIEHGLVYLHPEGQPLGEMHVDRWGNQVGSSAAERMSDRVLRETLNRVNPALVIVDGTTTLYRIHGLDTNGVQGTDLVGGWLRSLTNGNRRTVLLIDHTSKSAGPESGPIGSQHKIAMVQGAALRVKTVVRPRPGRIGQAALLVGKDRLGMVMANSSDADTPVAAEVTFDSATDPKFCKITYEKPDPNSTAIAQIVDTDKIAMLDALQKHAQQAVIANGGDLDKTDDWWMSTNEIKAAAGVRFKGKNAAGDRLKALVHEGKIVDNGVAAGGKRYRASEIP